MFKEGIININKPSGWTSQDICAKLRGRLHIKKIGHTGTLDPMATGVLPVCIGRATRIIEYFDMDLKTYRATMKLGIKTDTLDITGNVLEENSTDSINADNIKKAITSFEGVIEQIPPKYSAIRVNGKRAYELAREGKEVEIKPRKITIKSINVIDIDLENMTASFDVCCSKGTYIRTLCDDIGNKLGCGATLVKLERLKSDCFNIEDAYTIDEVVAMTDLEVNNIILSADKTLTNLGEVLVDDNYIIVYKNGNELTNDLFKISEETSFKNIYKVYSNNDFLGTGRIEDNILKPEKVIIFENN